MISSTVPQSRSMPRQLAMLFFTICIGCIILMSFFGYRRHPVEKMTRQKDILTGQRMWELFDDNSSDLLVSLKRVKLMLLGYLKENPLITIGTKLYRVVEVNNTSDEPIETRSAAFLDKASKSTDEANFSTTANRSVEATRTTVSHNTTIGVSTPPTVSTSIITPTVYVPSIPDLVVDGKPEICNGCLSGKKMITVQQGWMCGDARLGNKMSMIAAPYIAALHQKAEFVFIHNATQTCKWVDQLREIFPKICRLHSISANLTASWPVSGEKEFTSVKKIQIDGNLTTSGYRQTWKYYPNKSDILALRSLFIIDGKYRVRAIERLKEAANSFNVSRPIYIGVHMRMGDLMAKHNILYGYQMANESYYQRAFSLMLEKVIVAERSNQSIFTIATDSIKESKRLLAKFVSAYNLFWLDQTELIDFAALTMCNHTIISGGTYGFWAAALNVRGTIIYHDNFGRLNTTFGASYCSRCFNYPDWIPL